MENLTGFSLWLSQKGRKRSSVRITLNSLRRVQRLGYSFDAQSVASYLFLLSEKGKAGSYINFYVNAARLYGQYIHDDALAHLSYFKETPRIKATMSDEEISSFLSLPCPVCLHISKNGKETTRPTDLKRWERMNVFWAICAFTGMRMGEVAHLTVGDVDFGRSVFILSDTKTNTPRFVPIPPNITTLLQEYIKDKTHYLFPARRNGVEAVIDDTGWNYDFSARIKRLGIKRRNLTPYSLRHSMITRLLEEDVSIFKVQKIVGHKRIDTTVGYTHLTTKDIQEAITKHPLIRRSTAPESIVQSLREAIDTYALQQDKRFDTVRIEKAIGEFIVHLYGAIVHSFIMMLAVSDLIMIDLLLV